MDCPNSRDEVSAKNAQKFVTISSASESPNLHSSSNSNEVSTNSTDNLSYSPHDHIDELIFQNTLSDDDEHGSVDCIYAYRGAGADRDDEQPINLNENDDETDFLEMDFDPDPPSEVESSLNICNANAAVGFDQQELFEKEILLMNEKLLKSVEKYSTNYKTCTIDKAKEEKVAAMSDEEKNQGEDADDIGKELTAKNIKVSDELEKEAKFESTGAKPKKCMESKLMNGNHNCNVNYKNKKQQMQAQQKSAYSECSASEKFKLKYINKSISNSTTIAKNNEQNYDEDSYDVGDDLCLDCLEKEFLSKIIGGNEVKGPICNKCKVNQNRSLKTFCETSIVNINNNNINLQSLERYKTYETMDANSFSLQSNRTELVLSELNENSKVIPCDNINAEPFLGSIKISSINYDAMTLIQALTKLDIKYDESVINKYLNRNKTDFLNICDFLLYSSKKNCNYKRLMKIINMACEDKVKLDFKFDDTRTRETVQVKTYDILYYWQINKDLKGIKLLDRRFKEMNVLGKLINKIRQAQQRVTKQQLNDFIIIPQYYRSGYITITKA